MRGVVEAPAQGNAGDAFGAARGFQIAAATVEAALADDAVHSRDTRRV